jgi:hypothetical protein
MRLPSFRRTLLRVSPLLVVACASGGSPQPDTGLKLLRCRPVNAAFAEASVDSAGDSITVRGHTFHLRPGSVRHINGFRVKDRPDGYAGVDIEPHDAEFHIPAQLTVSYAHCDATGLRNLRIVEVEPGDTVIVDSMLDSRWDKRNQTVRVDLRHLSGYLIAGT